MIAKCPHHNLVRITRMRKTCPHCHNKLTRPTPDELRVFGENIMEHARAARCLIEHQGGRDNGPMRLCAFMAIFHGHHMSMREAEEMLS